MYSLFLKRLEIQNEHMGLNKLRKIWNLKVSLVFPLYLHLMVFAKVLQISKIQRLFSFFLVGKNFMTSNRKGLTCWCSVFASTKITYLKIFVINIFYYENYPRHKNIDSR